LAGVKISQALTTRGDTAQGKRVFFLPHKTVVALQNHREIRTRPHFFSSIATPFLGAIGVSPCPNVSFSHDLRKKTQKSRKTLPIAY
jgi:hypothetical protein